jgi:hypothetical protein
VTHDRLTLPDPASAEVLLADRLLAGASIVEHEGLRLPSLGGIPIVQKLGQGGMGAVYLGIKPLLRQQVAIKVLPVHLAELQPEMVDRFVREAQIAASIDSPHLVRVTDVARENGILFLVMEYVEGTAAGAWTKKLIAGGRLLDEATALEICIAASTGLAAAHERGIVHRDVKPDNILLPFDDDREVAASRAKLADLGLARSEQMNQALTATHTGMGTPGYMAPEQAMAARKAGKPADVFGMGATLYALLAGRAPFTGESSTAVMLATLQEPHASIRSVRPDVSGATAAVVDICLAKDAAARYPDAFALRQALRLCRTALEGEESTVVGSGELAEIARLAGVSEVGERVKSTPPPFDAPGAASHAPRRRRVVRSAGIGAGLLLTLLLAFALLSSGRSFPFFASLAGLAPSERTVTIEIAHSTELAGWIEEAATEFSRSEEGRGIEVSLRPMATPEAEEAIVGGSPAIDGWLASSALAHDGAAARFRAVHGREPFARIVPVAITSHVLVMFGERYDAFVTRFGHLSIGTVGEALADGGGWKSIAGRAQWGHFTFALTDPRRHLSGVSALYVAAAEFYETDDAIDASRLETPEFAEFARKLEPSLRVEGNALKVLETMVLRGPSSFDGALTTESAAVTRLENLEDRWGRVVIVYPEVNLWSDPAFAVAASTAGRKRTATEAFSRFLLTPAMQQRLVFHGYRPVGQGARLHVDGSPFNLMRDRGIDLRVDDAIPSPSPDVVRLLKAK